jgi:hypothetical protein
VVQGYPIGENFPEAEGHFEGVLAALIKNSSRRLKVSGSCSAQDPSFAVYCWSRLGEVTSLKTSAKIAGTINSGRM